MTENVLDLTCGALHQCPVSSPSEAKYQLARLARLFCFKTRKNRRAALRSVVFQKDEKQAQSLNNL